jgi:hypothetical protein
LLESSGYTAAAMADNSEVYFEITIVGNSAKVVALDAATGVEVAAIGPARASVSDLKRLALGKLKLAIAREAKNP